MTAAYDGVAGTATVTVTDATLVAIDVTPATATVPVGDTERFHATAVYSDQSTRDVTTQATWVSSNTRVATISNATGTQGLATGIAASATAVDVRATLSGVTGSASLTVTSASLQSIAVTPNPFTVAVRATQQLVAMGTFTDGSVRDVTTACAWSTSSRAVARVSKAGAVTGVAPGTVTITAKKKNTTGAASGTVA